MTTHNVKVTNPHAAVIVWNYKDRLATGKSGTVSESNDVSSGTPQEIEQLHIATASLLGVRTYKEKSNPAGQFEIRLAPTFNWVTRITPGSWCTIIITRDEKLEITTKNPGFARPTRDKMLGKIESVRFVTEVDPTTGARNTYYIATGVDWGAVFNQLIYIDPTAVPSNLDNLGNVGQAARILGDILIREWQQNGIPSCGLLTESVISLWGAALRETSKSILTQTGVLVSPQEVYELPKEVIAYYKLKTEDGKPTQSFGDLIHVIQGILNSEDKYSGDLKEAFGFVNPQTLYGINTFWQVLQDSCNHVLNELIADMRWDGDSPKLALYRRVRPFVNNTNFPGSENVTALISPFKNVKKIAIDVDDVISINGGTNVRDRVNFVEVLPDQQSIQASTGVNINFSAQTKLKAAVFDGASINRDGFKPMKFAVKHLTKDEKGSKIQPTNVANWKHLIKEWHFNTHVMLNGSMSLIGQKEYIQVGDNVIIESKVLGPTPNYNQIHQKQGTVNPVTGKSSMELYLCAQVESVEHLFEVDDTGRRIFTTNIKFVRGVITNRKGETLSFFNSIIDRDASDMNASAEKNLTVNATSTSDDPDTAQPFNGGNKVGGR